MARDMERRRKLDREYQARKRARIKREKAREKAMQCKSYLEAVRIADLALNEWHKRNAEDLLTRGSGRPNKRIGPHRIKFKIKDLL